MSSFSVVLHRARLVPAEVKRLTVVACVINISHFKGWVPLLYMGISALLLNSLTSALCR